jgi:hypothetical protein
MPSSASNGLLQAVNANRAVPHVAWRGKVRHVAVVLTSSCSGASLLKRLLAPHEGIAMLDCDAEAYLTLSGNGFGMNARSDAFRTPANAGLLADCIFDGLSVASAGMPALPALMARWSRRLMLQFPALFTQPDEQRRMLLMLEESLALARRENEVSESELQRLILAAVYSREPWRLDYYEGQMGPGLTEYFNEPAKLEAPPFVRPALRRRPVTADDVANKVLFFAAPSNAYRIGLFEQLFPEADVRYIHFTRGYANNVNSLMDGWLAPTGFFSHDMARSGITLNIGGYSDTLPFGKRWWKFDLPPDWHACMGASLEEVCLHQWLSCHRAILESGVPALRIAFEDYIVTSAELSALVLDWLGVEPQPVDMVGEKPPPPHWRERRERLQELGRRADVERMMEALGYRSKLR